MARSIRTDIEDNGKVDFLSRPILRTNPKLSTNIKLVVSDDDMYLESIDANSLLSGSRYKKYLVKASGDYSYDVANFWRSTATPLELAYQTKRDYSDFSILDSYDKQFEETYSYGTAINYSKLHNQKYRMFAPIWLDKNIPSKFIIYRVKDPVAAVQYSESENLERINQMLSNATLIETIDLSEESNIGKYLRKHVEADNFPKSALTASFVKGEQTFYNGIDLEKGGFASKGEYQYKDTIDTDKPLIEYNEFITDGFFRNSMTCANLINLEFLFDDDNVEDYSINRYFGIYVDEHSIGEGVVSQIRDEIVSFSEIEHSLDLPNGYDYLAIPNSDIFKKYPMLGWAKSFSNYHNVKNGSTWNSLNFKLKIDSNGQDYSLFEGIKKTERTIKVEKNEAGDGEFIQVDVVANPITGDTFRVFNLKKQKFIIKVVANLDAADVTIVDNVNNLSMTSVSGPTVKDTLENILEDWDGMGGLFAKYTPILEQIKEDWQIQLIEKENYLEENHSFSWVSNLLSGNTNLQTVLKIEHAYRPVKVVENTFICDNNISKGRFEGNSFSGNGTLKDVANSIVGLINERTRFETLVSNSRIYLKSPIKGYNKQSAVLVIKNDASDFLQLEQEDTNNSLNIGSDFLIYNTTYKFKGGSFSNKSVYVDEDDVNEINVGEYLLDNNSYNKVLDIVDDSRTIESEQVMLILRDRNINIEGNSNVYREFKMEWGVFSMYNLSDFDFDFYDTSNSDLKELALEEVDEYPNQETLVSAYSNLDNLKELPEDYFANLTPILESETTEDTVAEKIYSEFDRLQENYTSEFATVSRVIPTINKWSLLNSKNVRENPYYLNVNEAFGETNFSPDLLEEQRDKNRMTHEWFYIDKIPSYVRLNNNKDVFSYINLSFSALDSELLFDYQKLLDINFDYFKSYFLSNGYLVNEAATATFSKTSEFKKYTFIDGGTSQNFASTVFKGLRFIPKARKKLENTVTKEFVKTEEFNGYRFSACLKTEFNNDVASQLNIKVIENKKFKCITLVLDLIISEESFRYLNRKLLYELDHKLNSVGDAYANALIAGALDLTSASLSSNDVTIVRGVTHADGTEPAFTTQILADPNTGSYGNLIIQIGNDEYTLEIVGVINDNELLINGQLETIDGVAQSPLFFALNDYRFATYTYENGGVFAHRALLNQLSANNIANILNNTNDAEYITVEADGSVINNRFSLNVEDGVEVVKTSNLYPEVDTNKPKSFKLSNQVIGYDIKERGEYFAFLTRQNGMYEPNMKEIVTFTEAFSEFKIDDETVETLDERILGKALYKKLNGCKTLFNVGQVSDSTLDESWGIIKNHFFHKVNEIDTEGVIKLSEADELLPKYELINEIAIDRINKNVFKSRWEKDYYVRSLSGGDRSLIPGTKNIVEEKSYIGSSVIKTVDSYSLFRFTSQMYKTVEELNDIRAFGTSEHEINFTENKTEIIADFYLSKNVIKTLDSAGVRNTIQQYVQVEDSFGKIDTLDDDVNNYIAENILKLYSISGIEFYVTESKKLTTEFVESSNEPSASTGGYVLNNNFTYKLDPTNPLNFRLIYNKRLGFSYKIKPLIKIKA